MNNTRSKPTPKDVIVVVHGIGNQKRNATVRSVANRMAESMALRAGGEFRPVAPQPLGYFHSNVRNLVETRLIDDDSRLAGAGLASIGVAEVFWADVPQGVVAEGRTMEETKAWARTVVARAQALCHDAKSGGRQGSEKIVPPDFTLAAEVLDEIIETIYVLENLCVIAEKAGLFTFDLRQVLEEYLGDVQVVAEFRYYCTDIVGRFHKAMEDILAEQTARGNPGVRLHIVAHSEGTVVSFLGLLHAMSRHRVKPEIGDDRAEIEAGSKTDHPAWLKQVAGYMTIGSPIDKHLLLWPHLWEGLTPADANTLFQGRPIKWRNYYDFGDPVGFKLDTARLWLGPEIMGVTSFEFGAEHDHGFARYVLPGKAHNDYWDDPEVFEHFITTVVRPAEPATPAPDSKPLVGFFSPLLPYLLSFVVLVIGSYVLYKQVGLYVHPEPEPMDAIRINGELGIVRTSGADDWELLKNVFGVSALVAGSTLLARLPRLASGIGWKFAAAAGFLASCAAYCRIVTVDSRNEIGAPFSGWGDHGPTLGVCLLALLVGVVGFLATVTGNADRRKRWIWKGMRPLILCGTLGVAFVVAGRIFPEKLGGGTKLNAEEKVFVDQFACESSGQPGISKRELDKVLTEARFTREELNQFFGRENAEAPLNAELSAQHLAGLTGIAPLLSNRPPVWPVVLATAAFLYLWWLGALIFDLGFVWQCYVRKSVANDRLHEWYQLKRPQKPEPEAKA